MEPSLSGGMNSLPSIMKIGIVAISTNPAASTTHLRKRSTRSATGSYSQIRTRLMGFFFSGRILPLTKTGISAGASVTAKIAAKNMEKVLV